MKTITILIVWNAALSRSNRRLVSAIATLRVAAGSPVHSRAAEAARCIARSRVRWGAQQPVCRRARRVADHAQVSRRLVNTPVLINQQSGRSECIDSSSA